MPPEVLASASMRRIRTRSCNGRNFIEAFLARAFEPRALAVSGRECQRANNTWADESSCATNKELPVRTEIFLFPKGTRYQRLDFNLVVRPGINAAIKPAEEHRSYNTSRDTITCIAPRLRSGCVMVRKDTVWRVGIERCQSRIEAELRRAIGTEDHVRLAHIDIDMWVVPRWGHADALEFPHPDADFRDAAIVPELWIAAAGHRVLPS